MYLSQICTVGLHLFEFQKSPIVRFQPEETRFIMDEFYEPRLFARLKKSYADPCNTLTWALLIWSFTAVGFALFMPVLATMIRSIAVVAAWSALHLFRLI